MHSGRQLGGIPLYSGKQAHMKLFPFILHIEWGPQGDGSHGLTSTSVGTAKNKNNRPLKL